MIRQLLNEYISNEVKEDKVAILFSGGMDSLSILFTCLDLGIKPTLYSFYLKSYESQDIKSSRAIAKAYDLKLVEVCINDDEVNLVNDIKYIISRFGCKKKTAIQCIHPFLYLVNHIKEDVVLSGLCADDLYGTSKKMSIASKNIEEFNILRMKKIDDVYSSSYFYIKKLLNDNDKRFIAPYKDSSKIINYFMSLTYKDMNSPKQKNIMYEDFKEELLSHNLYRINSNLQYNSKLKDWHDKLIGDPSINSKNFKSVVGIYNLLYKEVLNDSKT